MKSDDIAPLLAQAARPGQADLGFRQGTCLAVNRGDATNTILIGGQEFHDLPVLNPAATVILPGDIVGVLRYRYTYFVLGKIHAPGQGTYSYWSAGTLARSDSQFDSWPSTTSGSYTDLLACYATRLSSAMNFGVETYVAPSTSGQFQLTINGTQVLASGTFTGGSAGAIGSFGGVVLWPDSVALGTVADVIVNARVTAGSGKVAASHRELMHFL